MTDMEGGAMGDLKAEITRRLAMKLEETIWLGSLHTRGKDSASTAKEVVRTTIFSAALDVWPGRGC